MGQENNLESAGCGNSKKCACWSQSDSVNVWT